MPGSRRVTRWHVPCSMLHAALLSRRHPLQIPPPQFRGSCQCVGSLVSYKVLSVYNRAPKIIPIAIHESGQSNRRMRHTTSRLQHGWHRWYPVHLQF